MLEFKVQITEFGIKVLDDQNQDVTESRGRWLVDQLEQRYPGRAYVYIAEHERKKDLYKIGVSERPQRRETEIPGLMLKEFICERQEAYELEAYAHELLDGLGRRYLGEWFYLRDKHHDYLIDLPDGNTEQDFLWWIFSNAALEYASKAATHERMQMAEMLRRLAETIEGLE